MHPVVYRRGLLVYSVLNDMAMYHGQQIKACQTVQGTVQWYSAMAMGAFWEPVRKAWGILSDLSLLDRAGFATSPLAAQGL
eukprot:1289455-Lingulodinium_polyedra.AAC.1